MSLHQFVDGGLCVCIRGHTIFIFISPIFKLLSGTLDRKVERVVRRIEPMVKDVAADKPSNYFNDLYVERTELLQSH
jgi:hypothetical protein